MRNAPHSHRPFDGFSDDAVDRFLAGESTPEEQERFQAYLARHIGDKAWTELFVAGEQRFASDVATGNARARLEARLRILGKDKAARKGMIFRDTAKYGVGVRTLRWGVFKKQPLRRNVWYGVTGVVVGACLAVAGWVGVTHWFGNSLSPAMATYATANGQRATITLTDGSTVLLDVASRLQVPADYAAGNHTVRLSGEALFTVTRHSGTPFTVITGGTAVRVLGTSFAVRHYGTDTTASVAVRDGKVAVGSVVVTAAQQLEVGLHGATHLRSADPAAFSFVTGVLTLKTMPLSRAVTELDRWYAADIRFGDSSLADMPIKGKFVAGSLSDLTEILENILDAHVVRHGRVLTLFPKAGV